MEELKNINEHIYNKFKYRVFDVDEILEFILLHPEFKNLLEPWIWEEFEHMKNRVVELIPRVEIPENNDLYTPGKVVIGLTTEVVEAIKH